MKIVLATKNEGKLRELKAAAQHAGLKGAEFVSLKSCGEFPDAVEDGKTFEENALIKAKYYAEKTGLACLADDSGLEVDVLGGAPGVMSARFAGGVHADDAANNQKLLEELNNKNVAESAARYRCVIAFCDTEGQTLVAEGVCEGVVKNTAAGTGGFGYDPYFYVGEKTLAQISMGEKEKISHRGKALRRMTELLEEYLK